MASGLAGVAGDALPVCARFNGSADGEGCAPGGSALVGSFPIDSDGDSSEKSSAHTSERHHEFSCYWHFILL